MRRTVAKGPQATPLPPPPDPLCCPNLSSETKVLAGLLALLIALMKLFPETPLARTLHDAFVARPLALAGRLERKHIILVVILLCCGQTLALAGSAELAIAYAVDMSIYADAMIAGTLATATLRLRSLASACKARLGRLVMSSRPRPRSRRPKSATRSLPAPSNDGEPAGAWTALAA
jgi:hypothetical protein